jgi:hypothetical protein
VLQMIQNRKDLRDALLQSSGFLADTLARYAYIEKKFYAENNLETKSQMENAIVQVYTAIFHHAVEVWTVHEANIGKQILKSVTALTDQPLSKLKSSVDNEEERLHKWVEIHQYLQHEEEAEKILTGIDEL